MEREKPIFSDGSYSSYSNSSSNEANQLTTDKNQRNKIGQGSYGRVYRSAYLTENNERIIVALKKIPINSNEGIPLNAVREMSVLSGLNHINIVKLIETSINRPTKKKKGFVSIIYEYIDHDISSLLQSKFIFSLQSIKLILYQILKGVQYLHGKSILHRDIKTANILINHDGIVKIADFGLARTFKKFYPINLRKMTINVVTLWYRAPELLLNDQGYNTSIDVWSIGCVFAELLICEPIFPGKTVIEQIQKIFEVIGSPNSDEIKRFKMLELNYDKKSFESLIPSENYENKLRDFINEKIKGDKIDDNTYDLLSKMLKFNSNERITVDDCLKHDFFSDINELEKNHVLKNEMNKIKGEYHGMKLRTVKIGQIENIKIENNKIIDKDIFYKRDEEKKKKGKILQILKNEDDDDDDSESNFIKYNNDDKEIKNNLMDLLKY